MKFEFEYLIKKGHLKEFIPSEKSEKGENRRTSLRKRIEVKKKDDGEVPVIHRDFAGRGDTMTALKHHIKKAKVISIEVNNKKSRNYYFDPIYCFHKS